MPSRAAAADRLRVAATALISLKSPQARVRAVSVVRGSGPGMEAVGAAHAARLQGRSIDPGAKGQT
jgi:hypothetical protein